RAKVGFGIPEIPSSFSPGTGPSTSSVAPPPRSPPPAATRRRRTAPTGHHFLKSREGIDLPRRPPPFPHHSGRPRGPGPPAERRRRPLATSPVFPWREEEERGTFAQKPLPF